MDVLVRTRLVVKSPLFSGGSTRESKGEGLKIVTKDCNVTPSTDKISVCSSFSVSVLLHCVKEIDWDHPFQTKNYFSCKTIFYICFRDTILPTDVSPL